MPAERCYVGAVVNGSEQFFQRDIEVRDGTKYIAKPYFVLNRSEATAMSEEAAKMFFARLRSLGANPWIEDAKDGRRIEAAPESQQSGQDNRTAVAATLDDENSPEAGWFIVRPANTPNGPKWFLRVDLPGISDPQIIYADDPLGVLQRAQDLRFLAHAVRYERPQPQAQAPQNSAGAFRRRPGSIQ